MKKKLFRLLLLMTLVLSFVNAKSQTLEPSRLPSPYSTNYYRIGWGVFDSGMTITARDTTMRPKFVGTSVTWQHAGVDTVQWYWDGIRWRTPSSGGGGGGSGIDSITADFPIGVTASPIPRIFHFPSGVVPGSYNTFTVNTFGLITIASNTADTLYTDNTTTLNLFGTGKFLDPLIGVVNVSSAGNNAISVNGDGLYVPNFLSNGLITPGVIVWNSNYNFTVSPATYRIGGITYTSPTTPITLTASDPSLNRIDVIAVDNTGAVVVITGTPATNPAQPSINPATQVFLGIVNVPAGSTAPTVSSDYIYRENIEWVTAPSTVRINPNSTNNPYVGSKDIEGTLVQNTDFISFTRGSPITTSAYTNVSFLIRSKGAWGTSKINMNFGSGSVVSLSDGSFGFNSSQTASYQFVTVPLSNFGALATTLSTFQFTISTTGTNTIGFYIDDIQFQNFPVPATGLVFQNGLTQSGNLVGLYGTLNQNDTLNTSNFSLSLIGTTITPLKVVSTSGTGATFTATTGLAATFTSSSQPGILVTSNGATSWAASFNAAANTNIPSLQLTNASPSNNSLSIGYRQSAYVQGNVPALAGFGQKFETYLANSVGGISSLNFASAFSTSWIDPSSVNMTSKWQITLRNAGSQVTPFTINANGSIALTSTRLEKSKGATVASSGDLTLGADGNLFPISGVTTINAITTTNWQAGSSVTLLIQNGLTIKNATAGGAGTAQIFLSGSVDFVAAANSILTLIYDGTQWQEVSRKVP